MPTREDRCAGSFRVAFNISNLSHLGPKFSGKFSGTCSSCRGHVKVSKGKATAHLPNPPKS